VSVGFERRLQATRDGGRDAGGRALDELAHALELVKGDLAVDAEFGSDFVNTWVGHISPVWGPPRIRSGH
jgi:hypothetical protein